MNKYCPRCKSFKARDCFHADRSTHDGVYYCCRECRSADEYKRPRSASTIEKAKARAAKRVFDPKKVRAKNLLHSAVKAGRVEKWPACAVPDCERTEVEAHHPDYDEPLLVTWLCRMHHRLAHNLLRNSNVKQ